MPASALAAAALARGRGETPRLGWLAGAVLAGAWTTFLGGGYLANLALVAAFLAAGACLARRTRRATVAAALLLAGGGLAHPEFFVVAVAVLVATASWSWRDGREPLGDAPHARADAGRVLAALGASVALVLGGILACLIGPARLGGDILDQGPARPDLVEGKPKAALTRRQAVAATFLCHLLGQS